MILGGPDLNFYLKIQAVGPTFRKHRSKVAQNSAKTPQDEPKMAPKTTSWLKFAQDGPRMEPIWHKMAPKWR